MEEDRTLSQEQRKDHHLEAPRPSSYYAGFSLVRAVNDLPFPEWRRLLLPVAQERALEVDSGIDNQIRVYGDHLPVLPPDPKDVLSAFRYFDAPDTRVVIIGQDCYPTPGQAVGLCFSVPPGVAIPPSLRNILAEVRRDVGAAPPDGDLRGWARQGVLLLNTALTVRASCAGSHLRMWSGFTGDVVQALAENERGVCFLLWGAHAMAYAHRVPSDRDHLVLTHSHPSPLARKSFLGCSHFSRTNAFLQSRGRQPIAWAAPGGSDHNEQ